MTDFMQPFSVLSSLLPSLVLDAVNENGIYFSTKYYDASDDYLSNEDHDSIEAAYDMLLEKFPSLYMNWEVKDGWVNFEMKERNMLVNTNRIELEKKMAAVEWLRAADELLYRLNN